MDRGVSQYIYRYIINILFVGGRLTPRSVKKLLRLGEWVSYALIAITIIITNRHQHHHHQQVISSSSSPSSSLSSPVPSSSLSSSSSTSHFIITIIIVIRVQIIEEQKEYHLLRVSIRFIVIS